MYMVQQAKNAEMKTVKRCEYIFPNVADQFTRVEFIWYTWVNVTVYKKAAESTVNIKFLL